MPRSGSGAYSPPLNSWNPPVLGAQALPADWQAILNDLATALQGSTAADGQTPITGVWNFGNNRIEGIGAPVGVGNALRWQQLTKGTDIASAATISIPNEGSLFEITGTTGITTINDTYPGRTVLLRFQDAVTLTHSSNLVLPTGADITTAAGDLAMFVNTAVGIWSVAFYSNAKGVGYDPTGTGRTATNVQDAINEGDLILGTAVSASGSTTVDFTGIPATAKRITVMFNGVSTNGVNPLFVSIGTSSGIESSNYSYTTSLISNGGTTSNSASTSASGVLIPWTNASVSVIGTVVLEKISGNTWLFDSESATPSLSSTIAKVVGLKTLSDAIERLRVGISGGSDQFDAGTINISWE